MMTEDNSKTFVKTSLVLEDQQVKALLALSKKQDRSLSSTVRQAIDFYLKSQPADLHTAVAA